MKTTIQNLGSKTLLKVEETLLKGDKSDELKEIFKELMQKGVKDIELDFSMVRIIDSSGIGKILVLYQSLKKEGGSLTIYKISEELKELFKVLRLDKIFKI